MKDQKASMVPAIRKQLYELIASCIPPTTILSALFEELMPHLNIDEQHKWIQLAASFDQELRRGGKPIFHLEAFVMKFLSLYFG